MSRRPRKKIDALTYEELSKQVKKGHLEPLYLFAGEEEHLHKWAIDLLIGTIDEPLRPFNVSSLKIGSDTAVSQATAAIDAANQLPMMAARRLVIVRDYDKIKEAELAAVLAYLKNPSPTTTLVFQSIVLDQRRKITAALKESCVLVMFDRLSEYKLQQWIEKYLKRFDCTITPDALKELIALAGNSMLRLANEMDKLAAYANGSTIDSNSVRALVPRAREHSNFELWDAIVVQDRKRALRLTQRLLDDGSEPVMIIGALAGLYRRMLMAKELQARGARADEISRATGQYGARSSDFNARVNRTPREEIVQAIKRIAEVDNAIKRSEGTPRLQIEYLMAELTLPGRSPWGIVG